MMSQLLMIVHRLTFMQQNREYWTDVFEKFNLFFFLFLQEFSFDFAKRNHYFNRIKVKFMRILTKNMRISIVYGGIHRWKEKYRRIIRLILKISTVTADCFCFFYRFSFSIRYLKTQFYHSTWVFRQKTYVCAFLCVCSHFLF